MKWKQLRVMGLGGAVSLALLLGYQAGRAYAEGAPATSAVAYSGTLLKGGVPVSGNVRIGARLWSIAFGESEEARCTVGAANFVVDASGRFRLPLDICLGAINENPELWLELEVNGEVLSPRAKLGAVPYALQAANATKVTHVSGQKKLTLQGRFCGLTAPVDGRLGLEAGKAGFPVAKGLCEKVQGCSVTAHVCLAEEVARLQQLDRALPSTVGWLATGIAAQGADGLLCTANDCGGFSDNDNETCGSVWTGTTVTSQRCNSPAPLLCCD